MDENKLNWVLWGVEPEISPSLKNQDQHCNSIKKENEKKTNRPLELLVFNYDLLLY